MNRRRNDLELRRTREGTYVFSSASNSGSTESLDKSEDTQDTSVDSTDDTPTTSAGEEHPVPMIYACATMWHEEEDEMKALFKSIFRSVQVHMYWCSWNFFCMGDLYTQLNVKRC